MLVRSQACFGMDSDHRQVPLTPGGVFILYEASCFNDLEQLWLCGPKVVV